MKFTHAVYLPPEIRNIIIGHLHDDRRAIASCGLISHAWHSSTRRTLFQSVRLVGSGRYESLEILLVRSPYLAPYVREVLIVCDGTFSWMDNSAPLILQKLPRVERLTIRNWSATMMSDVTRANLRNFFPKVQRLTLQDVAFAGNDLAHLLCACPKLVQLTLSDVDWGRRGRTYVDAIPSARIHLDSLDVRGSSSLVFKWLGTGPIKLRPRRMSLNWVVSQMPNVSEVLKNCGTTLEHLKLAMLPFEGQWVWPGMDKDPLFRDNCISQHTRLCSVHLSHELEGSDVDRILHTWLPNVLTTITSSHLRRLRITLRIHNVDEFSALDWPRFDRELTRLAEANPRLATTLEVHNIAPTAQVNAHDALQAIVDHLPTLAIESRRFGVLCVNCEGEDTLPLVPFGGPVDGGEDGGQD